MNVVEFGDALLRTGDLDPVYIAIHGARLPYAVSARLCVAYWCFYHLGVSARLAESRRPKRFWENMYVAARNLGHNPATGKKPWPRGAERRHFRGELALSAIDSLAQYKFPEKVLEEGFRLDAPRPFSYVSSSVQRHRGFGPWIAFKVADMAERVLGIPVDFSDCQLALYKEPRAGAALVYYKEKFSGGSFAGQEWRYPIENENVTVIVDKYVELWRRKRAKAPPTNDRLVNVQEIETIFCKYKAHYRGHYEIGKDIREVAHALDGWGDLAQQLKKGLPNGDGY
jgi:hypothetical protein